MNEQDREEIIEKLAQWHIPGFSSGYNIEVGTETKPNLYTAIELWKRWFDWSGNPWETINDTFGDEACFFCGENKPNHMVNCVFVEAKKLVELDELGELR